MTKESNNMLGEKIKNLRKMRGLTQAELAGNYITRNMLSSIENGTANPSLDTLKCIAERLYISVSYLVSEKNDLLFYEKEEVINNIYRAYSAENYSACINLISNLSSTDDELNYLLASSYLELGKKSVASGALITAKKHLKKVFEHAQATRISTSAITAQASMYLSISENIQAPLLEFDANKYSDELNTTMDYELYKYLTLDFSHSFITPNYSLHIEAKKLIKERNYPEAIPLLLNAIDLTKNESYNAFIIFGIYTDIEHCYKQLYDYEKAYLYSTKRMTLLENFKA